MFTGIIETMGVIKNMISKQDNLQIEIQSTLTGLLKPDESVAHNGICLTVETIAENAYTVTAVQETILKTNINSWKLGDSINLERAIRLNDRLDGHLVQGHIDGTIVCTEIIPQNGSYIYTFSYDEKNAGLLVEKGSVCINGISLTAFDLHKNNFSVAIIPYTYEHTNIKAVQPGDRINIEYDLVGKYILRNYNLCNPISKK